MFSSVGISNSKSCEDTYKVSKISEVFTEDDSSNINNDNSNESNDEENIAYEDNPTEYFSGTADGSLTDNQDLKTNDNLFTSIYDYVIYLVVIFVIGGTVLVFKKKKC